MAERAALTALELAETEGEREKDRKRKRERERRKQAPNNRNKVEGGLEVEKRMNTVTEKDLYKRMKEEFE